MTFSKQIVSLLFLAIISLFSCKSEDPNFRYVKLEEFRYSEATITKGTEIKILSFSGGKDCSPEESYYYQFIGVNLSTNDTLRILAPCQSVDVNARPTTGTFTPWQETKILRKETSKLLLERLVSNNYPTKLRPCFKGEVQQ